MQLELRNLDHLVTALFWKHFSLVGVLSHKP